jgi:hypothetical protein
MSDNETFKIKSFSCLLLNLINHIDCIGYRTLIGNMIRNYKLKLEKMWPILSYYPNFSLQGPRKTTEKSKQLLISRPRLIPLY